MFGQFPVRRTMVAAAAALAVAMPAQQAHADKAVRNAIIGIGGALILNEMRKNQQRSAPRRSNRSTSSRSAPRKAPVWSAERKQVAEVQGALNGFGWSVGSADGISGKKTRGGISAYQAYMGWAPTGTLAPHERELLMRAHSTYESGSARSAWPGLVEREGIKGILKASRDPNYYAQNYRRGTGQHGTVQAGLNGNSGSGVYGNGGVGGGYGGHNAFSGGQTAPSSLPVANAPNRPAAPEVSRPGAGVVAGAAAAGAAAGGAALALPELSLDLGKAPVSMAGRCEIVKLAAQTNQGQQTADNMLDPDQALSEQFCDARVYLIGQAQSMMATARNTEDQVLAGCGQIAGALASAGAALAAKGPDAMQSEIAGVSASLGLAPQAASDYGQLCLGLGYRTDDADIALAGAMLLYGAGRTPFAEMVGHHVREGFGTAEVPAAAADWYMTGLDALVGNEAPAVLPSQTIQRTAIIRTALETDAQRASAGAEPSVVPVANMLPALNLGNN